MNISIRKSEDRGETNLAWLKSRHSFSFGDYIDPRYMGLSKLRIINEDIVSSGHGFGEHDHKNMEIISVVIDGKLRHKDSLGNKRISKSGDVQIMSSGFGVSHQEYNESNEEDLHFLQIWIRPEQNRLTPYYDQISVSDDDKKDKLKLVVSPNGKNCLKINQDTALYLSDISSGKTVDFKANIYRHYWIQITKGSLQIDGNDLGAGDGIHIYDANNISITANDNGASLVLIDLP